MIAIYVINLYYLTSVKSGCIKTAKFACIFRFLENSL